MIASGTGDTSAIADSSSRIAANELHDAPEDLAIPVEAAPVPPAEAAPLRLSEAAPMRAAEAVAMRASEPAEMWAPLEPTGEAARLADPSAPDMPTKVERPASVGGAARAESRPSPFDDKAWRGKAGDDSGDDVGGAPAVGNPLREAIVAFAKSRRNLAIAAGGVLLLVVAIVLASSGGSKPQGDNQRAATAQVSNTEQPAAERGANAAGAQGHAGEAPAGEETTAGHVGSPAEGTEAAATSPTPTASARDGADRGDGTGGDLTGGDVIASAGPPSATTDGATTGDAPTPAAATGAATNTAATTGAATTGTTAQSAATGPKRVKRAPTLAGKQVVVEYDHQTRDTNPVPNAAKSDQAAISRARTSYAAGNTRLFAGDADGAIRYYKQALTYYPAYVAGYRGLGLAYAQKRDNANALKALRTYIGAAPNAKDAPLIRKRIQALSK